MKCLASEPGLIDYMRFLDLCKMSKVFHFPSHFSFCQQVEYSGGFSSFNIRRFGQQFVDRVANPKDILHFYQRKKPPTKTGNFNHSSRGVGGILPFKRLMGMCRWMRSHFHDWIDYNEVAFSTELLQWGRTFSDFLG